MRTHVISILLACCGLLPPISAYTAQELPTQQTNSYTHTHKMRSVVQEVMDTSSLPFSGNLIMLEDGKTVLELSVGDNLNVDSSFVVASLSKQVTATLILQALDAGKLNLSHSLNSYLFSDASHADNAQRYDERITLHHLLSHTSGVVALGTPVRFAPGSQFQYSNLGYTLLGQVLEKVNKQPFSEQITQFAKDNALDALYAKTGSINTIGQNLPSLATGWNEAQPPSPSNLVIDRALLPAGGLIASARTFARFQQLLHSGALLEPKSYTLMTRAHTQMQFFWPNMHYGYGLRINLDDGLTELSHTGYVEGYMSMSLHYPEFNVSVVMLENLALSLDDIERVLELHTHIRDAVRKELKGRKQS